MRSGESVSAAGVCDAGFGVHDVAHARFSPDVKFIQVDVCAEEMGNNVASAVRLLGDAKAVVGQLATAAKKSSWKYPAQGPWWDTLTAKVTTFSGACALSAHSSWSHEWGAL